MGQSDNLNYKIESDYSASDQDQFLIKKVAWYCYKERIQVEVLGKGTLIAIYI